MQTGRNVDKELNDNVYLTDPCHPLCNSFDIPVTSQWTVVNPTVRNHIPAGIVLHREATGLSLRTRGNPSTLGTREKVLLSSCALLTEGNRWSQSLMIISSLRKNVLAEGFPFTLPYPVAEIFLASS